MARLNLLLTPKMSVQQLTKIERALRADLDPNFWQDCLDELQMGENVRIIMEGDPEKLREAGFEVHGEPREIDLKGA